MDLQAIKALIDTMATSDLAELEFSENGWTIRLSRGASRNAPIAPREAAQTSTASAADFAQPLADQPETASGTDHVQAPLAGVVHLQAAPGEPPFVAVGQSVKAGDPVCVIEAMKVFNMIRADRDGTVAALLVTSGSEVDAGQILVRIV